jgi:hypothetical protein
MPREMRRWSNSAARVWHAVCVSGICCDFLRIATDRSHGTGPVPDKELMMHVIASDLIALDIAAEFDWSSAEVNQYLDSLLADDDNDWPGDADE